jgi:NAD(P)H-nitrite reductase large subunit
MFSQDENYIICRCEEVTLADVQASLRQGTNQERGVKLRTRAGMGICQGLYCRHLLAGIIAAELKQPNESVLPFTFRFPCRPVTLESLAKAEEVGEIDETG